MPTKRTKSRNFITKKRRSDEKKGNNSFLFFSFSSSHYDFWRDCCLYFFDKIDFFIYTDYCCINYRSLSTNIFIVAPYIPSYLEEGQKCVVCSDDATGLHYRAITCEGCKGFFRRVCQRGLQFSCKSDERCEINKNTRNVCQHCRLLKCFANGMSAELVLNEVERSAKRQLIERNRERKELERLRAQILRHRPAPLGDAQAALVQQLTAAWCEHIDAPLRLPASSELDAPLLQFSSLLKEILRRSYCFASKIPHFGEMDPDDQARLLVWNRAWLEIQLLRVVHQIDPIDGSLLAHRVPSKSATPLLSPLGALSDFNHSSGSSSAFSSSPVSRLSLSSLSLSSISNSFNSPDSGVALGDSNGASPSLRGGLRLADLDIGSDALLRDLAAIADSFQKLELDNEQLAVLSAILIFQPEFLPECDKIAEINDELWFLMEELMARNSVGIETPQRINAYPRLHVKVAQLRVVARRVFTVFFQLKNPADYARLFT